MSNKGPRVIFHGAPLRRLLSDAWPKGKEEFPKSADQGTEPRLRFYRRKGETRRRKNITSTLEYTRVLCSGGRRNFSGISRAHDTGTS